MFFILLIELCSPQYVATLLCGPVVFALLACGMSTWLTRQAGGSHLSTNDLHNASNVDDDSGVGFPHGLDVPSVHWANLFSALLRSHVLQNTNEGLSIEEIEVSSLLIAWKDFCDHIVLKSLYLDLYKKFHLCP